MKRNSLNQAIASLTVTAFGLYILSDLMEIFYGELLPSQLILTYIVMALIPFSMMGLYSINFKSGGIPLLVGAGLIATSFIYFSGTAVYAYVERISNYDILVRKLGWTYILHGILLVAGGLVFSLISFFKKLYPTWIVSLIFTASVISFMTGLCQLSENYYVLANFFRNIGFLMIGILMFKRRSLISSSFDN